MNCSVYFLKPWEEAVGTLSELTEVDGYMTATIGGICVGVPEDIASSLLQPNVGKRVGLLRTDIDYRFKIIKERDNGK